MLEVVLFVEDVAHQRIIGAIIDRLARDANAELKLVWRNVRQGHGKVLTEFTQFARDLRRQGSRPDFIVVGTDANCKGYNARAAEFQGQVLPSPLVLAVPEPHIERWLLLDGAAFKQVFGKGCDAPDQKCDRHRYKRILLEAIRATGIDPALGGIEFSDDLVEVMDIDRAAGSDASLARFVEAFRRMLRQLTRQPTAL